jgi:ATP-dependent helicase HrpB
LTPLALELAAWGSAALRWLDSPPPGPLAEARERLQRMDATDAGGRITAHGRALLRLGLHPRLAHAILRAPAQHRGLACDAAAMVEARDPLRGEARRSDDLRDRIVALARFRAERRAPGDSDRGALAVIEQAANDLRRRAKAAPSAARAADPAALGEILAHAFPERIARNAGGDGRRYQLASGRGARLLDESRLRGEAWLVASELRYDAKDSLILRAAPVDEGYLRASFAQRFTRVTECAFNPASAAVEAYEENRFDQIVLDRHHASAPRDARTVAALVGGIARLGVAALPWSDAARQWQARVECLRGWCPELKLPPLDDVSLQARLEQWLAPALAGKWRLDQLDASLLADALGAQLDHAQRRALEAQAPLAFTVPSGNARKLEYHPGQAPVLAVKLQELFGLADTPRVANGRVAVTLHLLSPGQQPIQVTQDLRSFWERTYPEVKKELQRRYPRHPWPDDPWSAVPTARAKPRARR